MESWKPHPTHPQLLVSDQGQVARILTPSLNQQGYTRVNALGPDGKRRTRLIHQLVLETFVGPRPPAALVRHLNDQPADNRLENLRWGTTSENTDDAFSNGGRQLKTHCPLGHKIEGANLQAKGRRCKACNQERSHAHRMNRDFDEARAHARYQEVMR